MELTYETDFVNKAIRIKIVSEDDIEQTLLKFFDQSKPTFVATEEGDLEAILESPLKMPEVDAKSAVDVANAVTEQVASQQE